MLRQERPVERSDLVLFSNFDRDSSVFMLFLSRPSTPNDLSVDFPSKNPSASQLNDFCLSASIIELIMRVITSSVVCLASEIEIGGRDGPTIGRSECALDLDALWSTLRFSSF